MKELLCSSLAILQCILHNPERVLLKISICFFILCSEFCIHLNFTLSKMWDLSINEGVKGLILVLRILQLIFPFIYIPSLPASLLWCDLPSPRQRLRTLPLYFCQKLGLELSSGPARPLRAGSAASWKKLWICSQVCAGRSQAGSFIKGTKTMVSLSAIRGRSCHWIDTVVVGTYPSRMERIQCYQCVLSKRYNMWYGQSFWGRMSKHSAQI